MAALYIFLDLGFLFSVYSLRIDPTTSTSSLERYNGTNSSEFEHNTIICTKPECEIICAAPFACHNTTINTTLSNTFHLSCSTNTSCHNINIINSPKQSISVLCSAHSTCLNATFNSYHSSLALQCTAPKACDSAHIYCPPNHECNIQCTGPHHPCYNIEVYLESEISNVNIVCEDIVDGFCLGYNAKFICNNTKLTRMQIDPDWRHNRDEDAFDVQCVNDGCECAPQSICADECTLDPTLSPTLGPTQSTVNPTHNHTLIETDAPSNTVVNIHNHTLTTLIENDAPSNTLNAVDNIHNNTNDLSIIIYISFAILTLLSICCMSVCVYLCMMNKTEPIDGMDAAYDDGNIETDSVVVTQGGIKIQQNNAMNIAVGKIETKGILMTPMHLRKRVRKDTLEIQHWLQHTVELPQYLDAFMNIGYESMEFVKAISDINEVIEIGIDSKQHQIKIFEEIMKLKGDEYNEDKQENHALILSIIEGDRQQQKQL